MADYLQSHEYEFFIRLVRGCRRHEFGAYYQYMLTLLELESNEANSKDLIQEATREVKFYLTTATRFALRDKKFTKLTEKLDEFIDRIDKAKHAGELLQICIEGNRIFSKYRNGFNL